MKILMVCLGNICRSPLAEGIMKTKLPENFKVDSAGTGNWHVGKLPDERSIDIAHKHGIDITDQRARQFKVEDFDTYDLIYVMDQSNYSDVLELVENEEHIAKVKMFLPNSEDVPDPYFGGIDGFQKVFDLLDEASNRIAEELINKQ